MRRLHCSPRFCWARHCSRRCRQCRAGSSGAPRTSRAHAWHGGGWHGGGAWHGGAGTAVPVGVRNRFVFHNDFRHFTPVERRWWNGGNWRHMWWHGRYGWWWGVGGNFYFYNAPSIRTRTMSRRPITETTITTTATTRVMAAIKARSGYGPDQGSGPNQGYGQGGDYPPGRSRRHARRTRRVSGRPRRGAGVWYHCAAEGIPLWKSCKRRLGTGTCDAQRHAGRPASGGPAAGQLRSARWSVPGRSERTAASRA